MSPPKTHWWVTAVAILVFFNLFALHEVLVSEVLVRLASEMLQLSPVSTTRVDGWPVSITRQHGPCWRARISTSRVDSGSGNRALHLYWLHLFANWLTCNICISFAVILWCTYFNGSWTCCLSSDEPDHVSSSLHQRVARHSSPQDHHVRSTWRERASAARRHRRTWCGVCHTECGQCLC